MKKYPFLSLKQLNEPYEQEIKRVLAEVVESGWYLHGKYTELLEDKLRQLCSVPYAVACSNGLDALRLILRAYIENGDMAEGDEVIVPANTYVASVLAITDNRLKPVFVEPHLQTMNLDINQIEMHITPRTRAVMVVHLYGSPCWSEQLKAIARKYNLKIVEDNAQAIGAQADTGGLHSENRVTGGLGDAAAFSFYPTKNIGALGDAGAVTTFDERLASTVRALANYGATRRYHNVFKGYNCRMDELQAAVLCVKLNHLATITEKRRANAATYERCIVNPYVTKPRIYPEQVQVWHQYEVRLPAAVRNEFRSFLEQHGVGTDIHYETPPHRQPCYAEYAGQPLLATDRMSSELVSLPISEALTVNDIKEISEIVNLFSL